MKWRLMRDNIHTRYLSVSAVVTVACTILLILSSVILYFFLDRGNAQSRTNQNSSSPVATATPSLSPSTTPQPLFYDDFTSQNKGWYLNNTAGYMRLMVNDSLTLSDTNHDILIESLPTDKTFNDFILTVVFTVEQAGDNDSMGVYVRGDANLDHDYRIDIYGNQTFSVSKEYLDAQKNPQSVSLVGPTPTTFLNPLGQQNVLTVIMNGPAMTIRINGSMVAALTDSDYTTGQIALFVQGSRASDQVTASFSSVAVYPILEQPLDQFIVTPQQGGRRTGQTYALHQRVALPSPGFPLRTPARGILAAS